MYIAQCAHWKNYMRERTDIFYQSQLDSTFGSKEHGWDVLTSDAQGRYKAAVAEYGAIIDYEIITINPVDWWLFFTDVSTGPPVETKMGSA